jgi:hypothetical protein
LGSDAGAHVLLSEAFQRKISFLLVFKWLVAS